MYKNKSGTGMKDATKHLISWWFFSQFWVGFLKNMLSKFCCKRTELRKTEKQFWRRNNNKEKVMAYLPRELLHARQLLDKLAISQKSRTKTKHNFRRVYKSNMLQCTSCNSFHFQVKLSQNMRPKMSVSLNR